MPSSHTKEEIMKNLAKLTLVDLTALYNTKADRVVKKFQSKATAIERIRKLMSQQHLALNDNADGFVSKQPRKRGAQRFLDTDVIIVTGSRPEKRLTKRDPYAIYATGMTVGQFLGHPDMKRRDVNWDNSQGYINVVKPEEFAKWHAEQAKAAA